MNVYVFPYAIKKEKADTMTAFLTSKTEQLARHPWQRILWNVAGALVGGLLLAFSILLAYTQHLGQAFAHCGLHPVALWGSALFLALLSLVLGLFAQRLWVGHLITTLVMMVLTLINHFKTLITSMPLELFELQLASKLGAITELNADSIRFSAATVFGVVIPLLWCAVLLIFAKPLLNLKWKRSLVCAGCSLVLFALCFLLGANGLIYAPAGVSLEEDIPQAQVYDSCSIPLGLWRSLLYKSSNVTIDVTDKDALEELMGSLSQGSHSSPSVSPSPSISPAPESSAPAESVPSSEDVPNEGENTPPAEGSTDPVEEAPPSQEVIAPVVKDDRVNVILILSESFFDVTTLPNVTFETDPVKEFHALQNESVSGCFFSRTMGYGTCNIELEILTGINTALLEQGDDPLHWAPEANTIFGAVPQLFRDAGYYTAFLHMHDDSIYNRTNLFSTMGFEDMFFCTDFAKVDPAAAAAANYYAYLNSKANGAYYSDDYMADLLIELYEQNDKNGPVFLYASSMENHGPYTATKYSSFHYPFTVSNATPSESAITTLQCYTEGAASASKSLQKLVDYFAQVEEPTVILFYGDHVPGLNTEDSTVYKEINMYTGSHLNGSPELVAELYSAEYLIWANDPSLLPAEPGTRLDTSTAFFGLDVLNSASIPLSRYWLLVDAMRDECQAYNRVYFVDANGQASWKPTESTNMEPFQQMSAILADAKKDRYLTDWVREVP